MQKGSQSLFLFVSFGFCVDLCIVFMFLLTSHLSCFHAKGVVEKSQYYTLCIPIAYLEDHLEEERDDTLIGDDITDLLTAKGKDGKGKGDNGKGKGGKGGGDALVLAFNKFSNL